MGKYLGIDLVDTYEIYLIQKGLVEWEGTNQGYFKFISDMKDLYFNTFLTRKDISGQHYVENFDHFHNWIAEHFNMQKN